MRQKDYSVKIKLWKSMNKDINSWCRECQQCSRGKVSKQPAAAVAQIPAVQPCPRGSCGTAAHVCRGLPLSFHTGGQVHKMGGSYPYQDDGGG